MPTKDIVTLVPNQELHKGAKEMPADSSLATELNIIMASLAGKPVPPQEWHIDEVILADQVTILSGNGGDRKSLLAIQLGVATATGTDWIGHLPSPGGVLIASAEDEHDEIHRRVADIIQGRDDLSFENFDNLNVIDLSATDAFLQSSREKPGYWPRRHCLGN